MHLNYLRWISNVLMINNFKDEFNLIINLNFEMLIFKNITSLRLIVDLRNKIFECWIMLLIFHLISLIKMINDLNDELSVPNIRWSNQYLNFFLI